MPGERSYGVWVIILSFICAFLLTLMPLPDWALPWRPAWVLMALLYWSMALPQRIGVITGWSIGIVHDLLTVTLIGQHALSYAILTYISVLNYRKVRIFPVWQQAIGLFVLVLLGEIPGLWIRGMMGYGQADHTLIYPAVTSMLLWHWVFVLLRDMRRTYGVSE